MSEPIPHDQLPKTVQQHNAQLTGVTEDLPYERYIIEQGVAGYDHDQRFDKLYRDLNGLVADPILRQAIVAQVLKTLML
jgi:hypothetical protein